jgi:23S rRNA pseudouridine2605 synthase
MRLQAFLARAGAAPSRRKAEAPILSGRVTVNGQTATLGARVTPEDEIELDGHPVRLPEDNIYLALNKPAGYLTTTKDDRGRPTVVNLMPEVPGLVPAGRLDAATTGLLILTNDGTLAHRITHPSSEIEKQYRLTLENPVPKDALAALAAGPTLEDGKMHPPKITNLRRSTETTTLDLTIHDGRNRIIRRACKAVGLSLISLRRTRVGPVTLGDLPEGEYRALTPTELEALR